MRVYNVLVVGTSDLPPPDAPPDPTAELFAAAAFPVAPRLS